MMGVIEWEHPPKVKVPWGPQTLSTLVQSGIKLFLHQRNQIPLPLEQLALGGRVTSISNDTPENNLRPCDIPSHLSLVQNVDDEEEDPRNRIRQVLMRRKGQVGQRKGKKKSERLAKLENSALETLTSALEMLNVSMHKNFDEVWAVSLGFGSSLHSLKELILFEFQGLTGAVDSSCSSSSKKPSLDMVPIIRSFYKSIIMSEEFCELTAKSLNSTRSHICLLTRKDLDEISLGDLIQIEETQWLTQLFQTSPTSSLSFSGSSSVQSPEVQKMHRKPKMKLLRIKINLSRSDSNASESNLDSNNYYYSYEKNNVGSLFDNNSFSCYQIPLRFKGVQCKNKC